VHVFSPWLPVFPVLVHGIPALIRPKRYFDSASDTTTSSPKSQSERLPLCKAPLLPLPRFRLSLTCAPIRSTPDRTKGHRSSTASLAPRFSPVTRTSLVAKLCELQPEHRQESWQRGAQSTSKAFYIRPGVKRMAPQANEGRRLRQQPKQSTLSLPSRPLANSRPTPSIPCLVPRMLGRQRTVALWGGSPGGRNRRY
jgi:hypothetical protein